MYTEIHLVKKGADTKNGKCTVHTTRASHDETQRKVRRVDAATLPTHDSTMPCRNLTTGEMAAVLRLYVWKKGESE
jgi:hypothetical protein